MRQGRRPVTGFDLARAAVALLCLALAPMPVVAGGGNVAPPHCVSEAGDVRSVARVIDGETLQVDGGTEVRLIGALAPRAFDAAAPADDWPLAGRARAALEEMVAGQAVSLVTAGRRLDRYGRLLAHVIAMPRGAERGQVWVQGEMLRRGLARTYALEGSTRCLVEMIARESAARETGAGLWAEPAYMVRGAQDTASLLRLAGTFQVVEGRALRVGPVRGSLFVNFGEDWRQDFTLLVHERAVREAVGAGLDLKTLEGRRVRVRGWIERRGGPLVEIVHPAIIETLADVAEAKPVSERDSRRRARRRATQPE